MFVLIQPLLVFTHRLQCLSAWLTVLVQFWKVLTILTEDLISTTTVTQILSQDTGQVDFRHKLSTGEFNVFILQLYEENTDGFSMPYHISSTVMWLTLLWTFKQRKLSTPLIDMNQEMFFGDLIGLLTCQLNVCNY